MSPTSIASIILKCVRVAGCVIIQATDWVSGPASLKNALFSTNTLNQINKKMTEEERERDDSRGRAEESLCVKEEGAVRVWLAGEWLSGVRVPEKSN